MLKTSLPPPWVATEKVKTEQIVLSTRNKTKLFCRGIWFWNKKMTHCLLASNFGGASPKVLICEAPVTRSVPVRVGNFRPKNYSAEDGIDWTIGLFRRNSSCSAEQKILGILFWIVPQRRKMIGILYHGTKLEANARNSILNHSAEETTTWNSILKHVSDENMLSILFARAGFL